MPKRRGDSDTHGAYYGNRSVSGVKTSCSEEFFRQGADRIVSIFRVATPIQCTVRQQIRKPQRVMQPKALEVTMDI